MAEHRSTFFVAVLIVKLKPMIIYIFVKGIVRNMAHFLRDGSIIEY